MQAGPFRAGVKEGPMKKIIALLALLPLTTVAQGKLKPVVDRVMPMADVRKAHELMEKREQFGKVVVVP